MNKITHFLITCLALLFLFSGVIPKKGEHPSIRAAASIPVQESGRIKPLDTVARTALLALRGKQSLRLEDGTKLSALSWIIDVMMRPDAADTYQVFRIDDDQLLALFGLPRDAKKYFSYNDLKPFFSKLANLEEQVNPEQTLRTHFEIHLIKLTQALTLYHQLIHALHPLGQENTLAFEYITWINSITPGMEAIQKQERGEHYDETAFNRFVTLADRYLNLSKIATLGIAPPIEVSDLKWNNIGQALLDSILTKTLDPTVSSYNDMIIAYKNNDLNAFSQSVKKLKAYLSSYAPIHKIQFEVGFNTLEPFYKASILYVIIFILTLAYWLTPKPYLHSIAVHLLVLTFIIHSAGIVARIWIQGRPPVTNLYSSAIFVGWAATLIALIFEKIYRNGFGCAVAGLIGCATLIIAHNLGLAGDTLEMVRAVLDSNFWLSTHVIVVTLGYAAMFLAGSFGALYILRSSLNKNFLPEHKGHLSQMTYAVICFATLFSFVGTMLGGIWADQSWGRFWGWDPKENGALLIVLWCAIMLHARWGKIATDQGFMQLAVFGNIITAWSWFGTNMLGVGLHSYGFMDEAFWALAFFIFSQLGIIMAPWALRRGQAIR